MPVGFRRIAPIGVPRRTETLGKPRLVDAIAIERWPVDREGKLAPLYRRFWTQEVVVYGLSCLNEVLAKFAPAGPESAEGSSCLLSNFPALVASRSAEVVGLLPYTLYEDDLYLLALGLWSGSEGQAEALVAEALSLARSLGRRRLRATLTNADLEGLGLYQRLNFRLGEVRLGTYAGEKGASGLPVYDEFILYRQVD